MKKNLIWGGGVFGAILLIFVALNFVSNDKQQTVSVTGECIITAPKDNTSITLRIITLDKNSGISMKQANDKLSEIMAFLKTQKVLVQTNQITSYEKTEWNNTEQKSVSLGTETNIELEVSSEKPELIETVLTKFAGVPNVYTENLRTFTSSNGLKTATEKCLANAVENARSRADAIAKSENRKIGKLVSAEYNQSNSGIPSEPVFRAMKIEAASFDNAIATKDTELNISVNAVFEIK